MSDPLQPEPPPVDFALLSEVFDNDSEQIREVLVMYLEQTSDLVEKLAQAIQSGDSNAIRHLAHKSAGASASCGMTRIVPLLRDLENIGKEQQLTGAQQSYALVVKEFSAIQCFLTKHLAS